MLDVLYVFFAVNLSFSTSKIGWISSSYGIAYLLTPMFMGQLVDRLTHRKSLLIATGSQAIISLFYILMLLTNPPGIFVLIIIGQVIRATAYSFFWPAIEVIYSEIAQGNQRRHERNISLFCICWSLGSALGTSIAGIFGQWILLGGFITISIVFIIAFGIVSLLIPKNISNQDFVDESSPKSAQACVEMPISPTQPNAITQPQPISLPFSLKKIIWLTLAGTLVFSIISKGIIGYFPNYSVLPEGLNFSKFLTGQLVFAFGLGRFSGFIAGQWITNSFKKLAVNILALSVLLVGLVLFTNVWVLVFFLYIIGYLMGRIYFIALELTLKYHLEGKGAKAGMFESFVGMGTALSPLIAGFLAEVDLLYPFIFFSGFSLVIGGILLWQILTKQNKGQKQKLQ